MTGSNGPSDRRSGGARRSDSGGASRSAGGGRAGGTGGRGGGGGRPQRGSDPSGARRDGGRDGGQRGGAEQRGSRHTGPGVPEGAQGKPVGADRARRRPDAPPRRPTAASSTPRPERPDLPVDDDANLPKVVRRDIDRTLGPGRRAREVALALSVGSQAIDEGLVDVALEMLAWAKDQAPRVAAIREAYGVARYLAEDYAGALTELQAYARMTGRPDQQHLIADCLRANGRDLDRIEAAVRPLLDGDDIDEALRAEGIIVLAGARADAGHLAPARADIDALLTTPRSADEEHHLRARSLAADLARDAGDLDAARRHLEVLLASDAADDLDAAGRLAALDG